MSSQFRLLHLSQLVADEVNELLRTSRPTLIYRRQLEESAGSISANVREGYGRRAGPDRNQFLRVARGSADETDDRLDRNRVAKRLAAKRYWRLRDRLHVIRKMITAIIGD